MIRSFFKQYGWRYLPGLIFLAASCWIQTLTPRALGRAIDLMSAEIIDNGAVYHQAALLLFIAGGIFVTRFIWRYFIVGNARLMENHLREQLFRKLQRLPASYFAGQRSGDLMAYAINDVGAVRQTFGPVLAMGASGIVTASLSIAEMSRGIDGRMTLVSLLPVPIAIAAILIIGRLVQKRFRRVQELFSEISGQVNETINGARVIKSFSREKEQGQVFESKSLNMRDANIRLANTSAWLNPIVTLVFGLCFAIGLIYGGNLVLQGALSTGDLVAFNGYLMLIQTPVMQLGRIVNMIYRGLASYKRLDGIMNQPEIPPFELTDGQQGDGRGDIVAKHLTFTYPGARQPALRDISFTLKEGQMLGLAGVTGSGKSTLVNLLLKIYQPPRGALFIGGKDICDIPAKTLRRQIGLVPQDGFLFSSSVRDNVLFYQPGAGQPELERAAGLACISRDILSFSHGYDTQVGERGNHISGGQKQRIALARALVRDPQILMLDDTLSAVDGETEKTILQNLGPVMEGKTSLVVSHKLSALHRADLILFLGEDGHVLESGTHPELVRRGGAYAAMNAQQERGGQDR